MVRRIRPRLAGYVAAPTVDARQLALDIANHIRAEAAEPTAPTLTEFAPRWIAEYAKANRQKPRGIQSKQSILDVHLLPRFGARPMNLLADSDIQALKADLSERSAKTVNNVLSVLNKLLKTAVRWRVLARMPVTIELVPVGPQGFAFYEFETYAHLIQSAGRVDVRCAVVVLLGGDAGLRMGEMTGLEWADVDFRREVLSVERSVSQGEMTAPKSGKARQVPLTKRLFEALNALHLTRRAEQARVLVRDDGSPVSEQTLRTWMSRAQLAAGLDATGALHCLRHTFCSHLAMRGAPPLAIKDLAGHSSLRTTMRYMHLADSEARRAIALLDGEGGRRESGLAPQSHVSPTGFETVVAEKGNGRKVTRRKQARQGSTDSRRDKDLADALRAMAKLLDRRWSR